MCIREGEVDQHGEWLLYISVLIVCVECTSAAILSLRYAVARYCH